MSLRRAALPLIVCTALAACGSDGPDSVGREYPNLQALTEAQEKAGFVLQETFGNDWPARVRQVRTERGSLTFTLESGQRRASPGDEGYLRKLVRLEGRGGRQVVVVFRSREKK